MNKLFLFILFTILPFIIYAQIRSDSSIPIGFGGIRIRVTDSTGRAYLPGAYVKLVSGKDTVNLVTDESGFVRYNREVKDSIVLTVSSLGFKTLSGKVKATSAIHVALSEKTYGITEVVVKGNMVAVISRGDTTRYNAVAFKTLVGDNMAELFKKFPGMEFDGNRLTFRGATVDRINIDDKRLFDNDVKLALENIRADDVISVDVYKESTDWDKLNNIKNGRKQTVANVKTRSKPNRVFNKTVMLAGGQEVDKNSEGRYEKKYETSGSAVFSQVGKMITANASYLNTAGNTQSNNLAGKFTFRRSEINKITFATENVITNNKSYTENLSEQIYFPTAQYSSRSYLSDAISNATNGRFTSTNSLYYTFITKDIVSLDLNIDYGRNKNDNSSHILATLDEVTTNQLNLKSSNNKNSISANGSVGYRKKFGTQESGVYLSCNANFSVSENDNNGWRVDTTASSTTKLYLTDSGNGWERNYGADIKMNIPVMKGFYMSLHENFNYRYSKTERTAIDMLTGLIDTTNTQDYTFNYVKNEVSLSTSFGASHYVSTGHLFTSIEIGWERQEQKRDEFFPKNYSIPRVYNIPTGELVTTFNLEGKQMQAIIALKSDPLPVEYLRDIIDDRNPIRLLVGNPDLKMPANLSVQIMGSIPLNKKGASVFIFVTGNNIRNYVTTKTEYFTEDTFLPLYKFTVVKGATLTTRENVSESWRLNTSAGLSMRLLGSNVSLSLKYGYEKTPSYIGADLYSLTANRYTCDFSFNTAFSSVFDATFKSSSGWLCSFNGLRRNDSFTENFTVEPRIQLGNRTRLILSGNYYHYGNRQLPDAERNDFILNSSISRRLDKKGNFTLSLHAHDIFNQQSSIAINLGEDYTNTLRTKLTGRYWLLKAELKF